MSRAGQNRIYTPYIADNPCGEDRIYGAYNTVLANPTHEVASLHPKCKAGWSMYCRMEQKQRVVEEHVVGCG
jgi:hypothetical protein